MSSVPLSRDKVPISARNQLEMGTYILYTFSKRWKYAGDTLAICQSYASCTLNTLLNSQAKAPSTLSRFQTSATTHPRWLSYGYRVGQPADEVTRFSVYTTTNTNIFKRIFSYDDIGWARSAAPTASVHIHDYDSS